MNESLWHSFAHAKNRFDLNYMGTKIPFELDVKGESLSLRDKMMLCDQNGKVVAVMIRMLMKFENTYKIYGLKPYMKKQKPSKRRRYEGRPLYEWARCTAKCMSNQKIMETIDGVKYVMDGVVSTSLHRQMRITRDDKIAVYCKVLNFGFVEGGKWEIRIGPGIDPALIIAFLSIMDSMNRDSYNS